MVLRNTLLVWLFCLQLASCALEPSSDSSGVASQAELSQAFLSTVYPVVIEECATCHSDGVYPFAANIRTQASKVGVELMGAGIESNRFLNKVGDTQNPHPNQEISIRAYPKLEEAVAQFFAKVKTGIDLGDIIQSNEISLNTITEKYPAVNNLGFLVYEAEGSTISKETKFEITAGSFQNSLAVSSTTYPSNPVSGSPRVYFYGACSANPKVTVKQVAHTADKAARKYIMRITARLIDPSTSEEILINNRAHTFSAIDILPYNKSYSSLTDSDYKNASDPTSWNTRTPLSTEQKQYIYDQFIGGAGKSTSIVSTVKSIISARGINPVNILSFLKFDSVIRVVGPRTLEPMGVAIHPDEPVVVDTSLPKNLRESGYADFIFTIPSYLSFGDIEAEDDIEFELYAKSTGKFAVSIDEINVFTKKIGDSVYPCKNATTRSASVWTKLGNSTKFKRGRAYRIRIHQTEDPGKIDSLMLRAVTEENAGDLNDDPTLTRFASYGRYDNGNQKKVKRLKWELPVGGFIEADMVQHAKFYEISSPIYIPSSGQTQKNLQLTGIDFLVNGQISKTDKSFVEQGIRPPYAIISYGAVFIPIENGPAEDKIALAFDFLELTNEAASLPSYKTPPPIEDIKCLAPEVFREKVFPIYTQLPVMLRSDYDKWATDSKYPYQYDSVEDEIVVPSLGGGQFKCISCHDSEHPFFPIPKDYNEACDEALSRSNLDNPYLSYAIRGLRGQFEHPALYIAADITDNDKLRYTTIPGTDERVYFGPQTGKFRSYTLPEIESFKNSSMSMEEVKSLYLSLQVPKYFYIDPSRRFVDRSLITEELTLKPHENFFKTLTNPSATFGSVVDPSLTVYRAEDSEVSILDQHKQILDKLVESFVSWVEEEKKLRK